MRHRKVHGRAGRPKLWHRVLGIAMTVLSVPLMGLAPFVFLGMQIDGFGYVTGHGQSVTVTVVKGSRYDANGPDHPGEGYYLRDGERQAVKVGDAVEGQKVRARLAVTADPDDGEMKAYVGSWAAIQDIIWASVFMVGSVCLGLGLFRAGRGLNSAGGS